MKQTIACLFIIFVLFISCQKEFSTENIDFNNTIGANCRINKIAYSDSVTNNGKGAITATIDSLNNTTNILDFDSLTLTINSNVAPQYFTDTVTIDAYQYFRVDTSNTRIVSLHGLVDPSVPTSSAFDVSYIYNTSGYLITKIYNFTTTPGVPFLSVNYTYTNNNLTQMIATDLFTGDLITDAFISYDNTIFPKNYLYIFPDESSYSNFTQFYNFGLKSVNAITNLKVRYYNTGSVLADSTVSTFSSYSLSQDNYVKSVFMLGSNQSCIPALSGKLSFTYKCK